MKSISVNVFTMTHIRIPKMLYVVGIYLNCQENSINDHLMRRKALITNAIFALFLRTAYSYLRFVVKVIRTMIKR